MSEEITGSRELIIAPVSPGVVQFNYAHVCHSALVELLVEASRRAIERGKLPANVANFLIKQCRRRNSAVVRQNVELVMELLESAS